jgi:hypothetical protein
VPSRATGCEDIDVKKCIFGTTRLTRVVTTRRARRARPDARGDVAPRVARAAAAAGG